MLCTVRGVQALRVVSAWQEFDTSDQPDNVLVGQDRVRCCKTPPTCPAGQATVCVSTLGIQVCGGITTLGAVGTFVPSTAHVLRIVDHELQAKLGQAGVPPVHNPVLRWVMVPELPEGQAIFCVSEVGAQMHEFMVVAVKDLFCPIKRNVNLVVAFAPHC